MRISPNRSRQSVFGKKLWFLFLSRLPRPKMNTPNINKSSCRSEKMGSQMLHGLKAPKACDIQMWEAPIHMWLSNWADKYLAMSQIFSVLSFHLFKSPSSFPFKWFKPHLLFRLLSTMGLLGYEWTPWRMNLLYVPFVSLAETDLETEMETWAWQDSFTVQCLTVRDSRWSQRWVCWCSHLWEFRKDNFHICEFVRYNLKIPWSPL